MEATPLGVTCPNRSCNGFIVLIAEELDFVRLEGWESHLNVICPFCNARFHARATDVGSVPIPVEK